MKSMTGVLTLVQEERFQLADGRRNHRLFELAADAALEGGNLHQLQREGSPVRVDYDDVPGVLVHAAHRVVRTLPRE